MGCNGQSPKPTMPLISVNDMLDAQRVYLGKNAVLRPGFRSFPRQKPAIVDEDGIAAASADTTNSDAPYPTNIVRRNGLVLMRQPHHYRLLVKWHE